MSTLASVPTTTTVFSGLTQFIAPGDKQGMLIGIAGVAVVVWTAGFVVRSLGHRPNRGLIAAMTYAQLAFMGGLVAAFLTPTALQAVAIIFLLQELYQIPNALYRRAKSATQRTFGDQQYIEMLGIETRGGVAQYLALQVPYVAGIILVLVFPSQFVVIPLAWVALYLSYQIMLYFLFSPRDGESPNPISNNPSTAAPDPISLALLKGTQSRIFANLNNAAIVQKVFGANAQAHAEARMLVQQLDDETNAMTEWNRSTTGVTPLLLASAYVRAVIQHRLAAERLTQLLTQTPLPATASGLLERIMAAERSGSPLVRYSVDGTILNVNLWDLQTATNLITFSVYLLAESYVEEINGALIRVEAALQ
jgi:hypothetical protein